MAQVGKVWLVGAGPGDLGLLTLKGKQVLEEAEVIVYDALISTEILGLIPSGAEAINVGKRASSHLMRQDKINELLLEKAMSGKKVVRLKGGDPFVFGRGGEELELLYEKHIPFEIVPGITSSVAVPAYAGIPVTHRDYASSFHIITGHIKENGTLNIDFASLVKLKGTLVFLMGISAMELICTRLIEEGMDKDMPAAILERGTLAGQRRVTATVSTLCIKAKEAQINTPAIILIGEVCGLEEKFSWAEKRPLGGKQILVTRPKEAASIMAEKLRRLGAQVIEMPAIDTVPITDNLQLCNELKNLGQGTKEKWVVFTSPQGVKIFFQQLHSIKIDMRQLLCIPQLRFAVIGKGTKMELEGHGIFADLMPDSYSAGELGKKLGEEVGKDSHIVIFRAKNGSEDLLEELKKKNILYRDIAIYETKYHINHVLKEKVRNDFKNHEIDYVTFTSASTVKGFVGSMQGLSEKKNLEETEYQAEFDFGEVNAICIGQQTAQEARKYGMKIKVSKEASMDSMIELLCQQGNMIG